MSFHKMKVEELKKLADDYAVDIESSDNKQTIISKLIESGVTYEYHESKTNPGNNEPVEIVAPSFDEPAEVNDDAVVLMKMTRENGTFEVRGVKFTRNNPYAIVRERDADFIIETYEGFRIASPKEVKEFYG